MKLPESSRGRIIKNNPGMACSRIKQIMDIVDNGNRSETSKIKSDKVKETIKDNRGLATQAIMEHLENKKNNKTQLQSLSRYLKSYISKLNKEDIIGLYKVIEYYKDVYEEFPLYDKKLVEMLDLEYEVLSLYEVLYKFFSKAVLLPNGKKQEQFNKQMDSIIYNYEQMLEVETLNKPFVIEPINPGQIFSAMYSTGNFSAYGIKELNSDFITNLSYDFSLNSIDPDMEDEEEKIDVCSFTFNFYRIGENGLSSNDFNDSLKDLGITREIEPGTYFVGGTQKVNILLDISRSHIELTSDGEEKEKFSITLYSEDITSQKAEDFLDSSLYGLHKYTDQLINGLYDINGEYPDVQDRVIINYYTIVGDAEEDDEGKDGGTMQKGVKKANNKENEDTDIEKIDSELDLDKLILETKVEEELEELYDLFAHSDYFINVGVDFPKGTIFYGPPGNGKTLSAKVLASMIDAEFKLITHDEIESKWVGESEQNVKKEFNKARARFKKSGKKQIIYLEEGDSLLEARGSEKNHKEGIVSVILSQMDGFDENTMENLFVLISTNRIEAIDPAIKRRFDKKLYFGLPSKENRVKHFKLNIDIEEEKSGEDVFDKNIDFDILAEKTNKKSGSFIATLMKNSKRKYYREKRKNHKLGLIDTNFILERISFTEGEEKNTEKVMGFIK